MAQPISGTNGNDSLIGTPADDLIKGRDADDDLFGEPDVVLNGEDFQAGDDAISGDKGDDVLV